MNYAKKLQKAISESHSCLCVGLDPHLDLFPDYLSDEVPDDNERVTQFLTKVVEITAPYCAAYKPNLAFFEALGDGGLEVFHEVINSIPEGKIVIGDAKRGDIDSTARHYREAFFDIYDMDAITLNPLMGFETLAPYFKFPGKGLYVLTLTSNPGASDFLTKPFNGFATMAEYIATKMNEFQSKSDAALGMVVGATKPRELGPVLEKHSSAPLLIPGVGSQGGSIEELKNVLHNHTGAPLISSSRSILFAGGDDRKWERAVLEKVKSYRQRLMPITQRYE
ncbi:orotidine-5'-phosphate decarboxylase [Aliifodinibius sp. S!AR15-10]|uniref:orotidine-5'-phosphate decarboxylase n=1 Tax=Aliifodinibius sp. S!AR15-10 TaxID=2950437 RepID=UPI0028642230|nr:orotidine-5'-phosphate decarboxylase [Aliifodinibius sp. S!AR15-10]MDR8393111.1 orotidine-5'-phosphate decarboxylase [Aliifodinibius sp. S!AR15-10]